MSYITVKLEIPLNKIILWGFSLGSAPTVEIASRFQNLAGVILQAPLASLNIWMNKNASWNYNYENNDIFCNICKIENIKSKIFIIHGKNDKIINVRHSYFLYKKYINSHPENNQIWVLISHEDGHNDMNEIVQNIAGTISLKIQNFISICKKEFNIFDDQVYNKYDIMREIKKKNCLEKEISSLNNVFKKYLNNDKILKFVDIGKNKNCSSIKQFEDYYYQLEIKPKLFVGRINIDNSYFKIENIRKNIEYPRKIKSMNEIESDENFSHFNISSN